MIPATRRDFLRSSLGLASLLLGCRSEESEAPPGPGSSGAGSSEPDDPASTPPPPAAALRPYQLELRSAGGRVMAVSRDEHGFEAREWTSWLRVRSDQQVAELIITRHGGDLVDRPVGRFRQVLDDAALVELQAAIESTPWADLPEPLIGDPTTNWLSLEYQSGESKIQKDFSASAHAFITAIGPLMERLNATMSAPLAQPLAAIAVVATVAPGKPGKQRLRMTLRNVGTEPVVITDPRVPGGDDGPRARMLVAAQPSGYDMPNWIGIGLPKLPASAPDVVVLAGGDELAIDVDWTPVLHGPCLLHVVWQDYAGPLRPAFGQLPFLPLPERGPSSTPAPYPVRGAAFSSYAPFDA